MEKKNLILIKLHYQLDIAAELTYRLHPFTSDAKKALGDIPSIRNAFIGFQVYLYEQRVG